LPPLLTQSRTERLARSGRLRRRSLGATILEIPSASPSRARWAMSTRLATRTTGWIPENGKRIGKEIADKLSELRPNDKAYFQQQLASFRAGSDEAEKRWLAMMAPYKGTKMVPTTGRFELRERFGLDIVGYVERGRAFHRRTRHTRSHQRDETQNVKRWFLWSPTST